MKKKSPISFLMIAALVCLLASCQKKQSPQEILENNIRQAAREYIAPEQVDTVIIREIDTLSSLGYAILMRDEVLPFMQAEFEYDYKEAMFEDNEIAIMDIELSMTEIEYMLERFDELMGEGSLIQDDVQLLCVVVEIQQNGRSQSFDFFTTIDGKLHILDPFNNNLLLEEFAAK